MNVASSVNSGGEIRLQGYCMDETVYSDGLLGNGSQYG
jgi:hypothetical protein